MSGADTIALSTLSNVALSKLDVTCASATSVLMVDSGVCSSISSSSEHFAPNDTSTEIFSQFLHNSPFSIGNESPHSITSSSRQSMDEDALTSSHSPSAPKLSLTSDSLSSSQELFNSTLSKSNATTGILFDFGLANGNSPTDTNTAKRLAKSDFNQSTDECVNMHHNQVYLQSHFNSSVDTGATQTLLSQTASPSRRAHMLRLPFHKKKKHSCPNFMCSSCSNFVCDQKQQDLNNIADTTPRVNSVDRAESSLNNLNPVPLFENNVTNVIQNEIGYSLSQPLARSNIRKTLSKEDPGPSDHHRPIFDRICLHSPQHGHIFYRNKKSSSCPSLGQLPGGSKYKLIREGQIQICKLLHPRNMLGKLTSSKFLRRWETHFVVLDSDKVYSKTPTGFLEQPIFYSTIEDIHIFSNWDSGDKFCFRIYIPEGSILFQTNHRYSRNQWLISIQWKRMMLKFNRIFESLDRPEILLKELKGMVEQVQSIPLQDDSILSEPLEITANIMQQIYNGKFARQLLDPVIICVMPLLENCSPTNSLCIAFSRYCSESPRSNIIDKVFSEVAHQILKKNMDFGKYPSMRSFVQSYLIALNAQNDGLKRVKEFVRNAHGPAICCPHPRILPNLVSVCLAAIRTLFEENIDAENSIPEGSEAASCLRCFTAAFDFISEFDDWRLPLASILQPLPFTENILSHPLFAGGIQSVVYRIGTDSRCDVHMSVLGVREGREGWFHLYCPGGLACQDEGDVYAAILNVLLHCCCKRKKFLLSLNGMVGPLQLLALRENEAAMEALCNMLEMEVVDGEDTKIMIITALQSTTRGKRHYTKLCDRQIALRELQQRGGPRKLTLPSKSTDQDLAVLLSSGSFGNLESLSLAFTNVTSRAADYLIRLPSLKYLNLWSTQFGDLGVQLISEHLHRLQVLNLCETPVTDKGLIALTALKSMRKLNLNSTQLSAKTFRELRAKLPALQEVDVRYTDAWCSDDFLD